MLGRQYALLTARFLHTDERDRPSVLLKIIGNMIQRGNFWDRGRHGKYDPIAIGFVNAISCIMRWAYANGTVREMAAQLAHHYEDCAQKAAKDRSPRYVRAALAKASEQHRQFVIESSERRREARP
jgi:hypothetical protein